jgi:hypothetical protein
MKIATITSEPVTTHSGAAPSSFRIKASARAFKILSGFYSDPILAIPRELGANAWDSHVRAGKTDVMFEVHAPNSLEPWYSIRDFGTGLSKNAIEQIYTTYFESTKTQDNDSDGCMGLGSKTPFNYTENFSVTSWYEGFKHVYNCFIDGHGVPSILHFASEPSSEPNGVEVKLAIKANDISMFVDKIRNAYSPFRFRPVIKGAVITYPDVTHLFKGNDWAIREPDANHRYNAHRSYAYMGNYSYPIDVDKLFSGNRYSDQNYTTVTNILNGCSLELYFNIGDLEVAPNKEQLQYDADQKTQKAIIKAAVKAHDELKKQVDAAIEKPSTYWEAMNLYRKYSSHNSPYHVIGGIIGSIEINFNKEKISSTEIMVSRLNDVTGLDAAVPANSTFGLHYGHYSIDEYEFNSRTNKLRNSSRRRSRYYNSNGHKNCYSALSDTLFFITNDTKLRSSKISHYLKTTFPDGKYPSLHVVSDLTGNKVWDAHKKYLGLPSDKIINIDTLPRAPIAPRQTTTAKTNEIHCYKIGTNDYWSTSELEVDSNGTYYYIDYLYTNMVYKDETVSDALSKMVIGYASENKLIKGAKEIYGINRKNQYMLKTGTWVNLMELVDKHVQANPDKIAHEMYVNNIYLPKVNNSHNMRSRINKVGIVDHINLKKTKNLIEKFISLNLNSTPTDMNLVALGTFLKIKEKKLSTFDDSVFELMTEFNKKYLHLFEIIDTYSATAQKLATLINFIDSHS